MGIDPTLLNSVGRSRVSVTQLGLGTGPASRGLGPSEGGRFASTLRYALAHGISYVDTAPAYYLGASEEALGKVARGAEGTQLVVSTKVGRLVRPGGKLSAGQSRDPSADDLVFDFSREGVLQSVDESLQRTGLSYLDIVMIHDPDLHMDRAVSDAYPALKELKDEGTIGAIGAGMTTAQPLARLVRETDIDCVLLAGRYTLLDQSALAELLPLCVERRVSVILGGVFNGGVLADPSIKEFNYAPADSTVLEKTRRLANLCAEYSVPLKAVALQFPFGHPAVTCVLSGTITEEHLRENIELMSLEIPSELWDRVADTGFVDERAPLPRPEAEPPS